MRHLATRLSVLRFFFLAFCLVLSFPLFPSSLHARTAQRSSHLPHYPPDRKLPPTFETEAQVLELANDSSFGLAAAVLSKDEVRAQRVIRGVKAGICWVNCSQPCFCQAPWGGVRKSGIGRDNGELGMESFLEVKQVTRLRDQNLPPLASSAAPLVNCSYALLVSDAHGPGVEQVTTYKSKEPWGWYIPPGFTRPAPQQSKL